MESKDPELSSPPEPASEPASGLSSEMASENARSQCCPAEICEKALMAGLSQRQKEVLHWICEGKRDREIGIILGISYRTVTVHVRAILNKLGVENRTCAAMMGSRLKKRLETESEGGVFQNTYAYVLLGLTEMLIRGAQVFTDI